MTNLNPMLVSDFYKQSHREQYPQGTEKVYSTWTPRTSRIEGIDKVVCFGIQSFVKKYLIDYFNKNFFDISEEEAVSSFERMIKFTLGKTEVDTSHIRALHQLGYLPIEIKSLKEGTLTPIRVPMLTIENTNPDFFWLTNFLETLMSCELWQSMTSATLAFQYRKIVEKYAKETCDDNSHVPFQCHDFSMRGMSSVESSISSGMGHLLSFSGTDTIPAIFGLEQYYNANIEKELVGTSIPACYDSETEILTENGWKLFKDLKDGEKVAQYHEDGSIDFVVPLKYYAMPYKGKMIHFDSEGNHYMDVRVTPNHRMFRRAKKTGKLEMFEADDSRYHFKKGYSTTNEMIVSGKIVSTGKGMTSLEKLKVAFQADGSYPNRDEKYNGNKTGTLPIRFSLKKERKRDRLVQLCDDAKLEYTVSEKDKRGYYSFWIKVPERFSKIFNWINLSEISKEWADDFIYELQFWDGCKPTENTTIYSSIIKDNVDMVHAIVSISGRKGQYRLEKAKERPDGCTRQDLHQITILENKDSINGTCCIKKEEEYDDFVYCVSIPTKMLIVRRNNVVCMSGNTEHSVMCSYGNTNEFELFKHLLLDVYPTGLFSAVSDTWDLWKVVTEYIPALKEEILGRDGRLVVRPDSGVPEDIVCGDINAPEDSPERKGVIELLWETFGGTINSKGYKVLDPHIGCIYGDSITLARADEICKRLKDKGFASSNIVFGVGSFTYQYNTRDTFGFALKATYVVVNGEEMSLNITTNSRSILNVVKNTIMFTTVD